MIDHTRGHIRSKNKRIARARARIVSAIAVFVAMGAAIAAPGCKKAAVEKPPPPTPEVVVGRPVKRPVTENLEYTGTTEALATVDLRARVQGYLEQKLYTDGRPIKKGDLLFVIEEAQYKTAVDRATSDLVARRAALLGAEADAELAATLAEQRAGPEIDRVLKASRRDSAKANVAEAEATLERAKLDLSYCRITAPMDGVITKGLVDVGNLVGHGGPTQLATIVSDQPIYVNINASEADLLRARRAERAKRELAGGTPDDLAQRSAAAPPSPGPGTAAAPKPGTQPPAAQQPPPTATTPPKAGTPAPPRESAVGHPVLLAMGDEQDFTVRGEIDYVDPNVNHTTGTIGLRMIFDNADSFLLPGMFVRIRIPLETRECFVVPQAALSQDQAGFFLLCIDEGGTVVRRRVKVGAADGLDRVILEGVGENENVILEGLQRVRLGGKAAAKQAATKGSAETPAPAQKPSLRPKHSDK